MSDLKAVFSDDVYLEEIIEDVVLIQEKLCCPDF